MQGMDLVHGADGERADVSEATEGVPGLTSASASLATLRNRTPISSAARLAAAAAAGDRSVLKPLQVGFMTV